MKSQFYEAYVAGLCPLLLLFERGERAPDGHPKRPPAPTHDASMSTGQPGAPSRRRRSLFLVLVLAIGAWQSIPRSGERPAADISAGNSALHEHVLSAAIAEREGLSWQ